MIQVEAVGGSASAVAGPLTEAVSRATGVSGDRVFLNYTAFAGSAWAMGGATFG